MNVLEFLTQLTRHPELDLVFEFDGIPIRRGYHLTEVLGLTVDAIDCGGAVDHWTETVLQLVEPGQDDGMAYLTAVKAADILTRSQARVALADDSTLVLEFRAIGAMAAQRFLVTEVERDEGALRVLSVGTGTQCKPAARRPREHSVGASGTALPERVAACCAAGALAGADRRPPGCCA